jgi:hypothetical protein
VDEMMSSSTEQDLVKKHKLTEAEIVEKEITGVVHLDYRHTGIFDEKEW